MPPGGGKISIKPSHDYRGSRPDCKRDFVGTFYRAVDMNLYRIAKRWAAMGRKAPSAGYAPGASVYPICLFRYPFTAIPEARCRQGAAPPPGAGAPPPPPGRLGPAPLPAAAPPLEPPHWAGRAALQGCCLLAGPALPPVGQETARAAPPPAAWKAGRAPPTQGPPGAGRADPLRGPPQAGRRGAAGRMARRSPLPGRAPPRLSQTQPGAGGAYRCGRGW